MDLNQLLVVAQVFGDLRDAEEQAQDPTRVFLKKMDAFALSDTKFIKFFRLNKELARNVVELVTPYLVEPSRRSALSAETKVLVALKFFGLGSYQKITGTNSYTGVSQSSVSRAIREVCDALTQPHIFQQWVHFPRNIRELDNRRRRFYEKYEFSGVIGVIDCTHVAIVSPKRNDDIYPEHIYVNRKNYHSINVQLICDENLKIMNVNARFPGSCHNSHIWRQSAVSETIEQIYRQNNNNIFYLIGDSGYPLRPWLLTPLQDVEPGTPEERFNNQFKSIRSIIERCNGVLKNRFRCLIKHRVLHYTPEVASKIINTCIILHNMCVQHNVPVPDEDMLNADWGMNIIDNNQLVEAQANIGRVNEDLAAARVLQQRIIRQHFNN